MSVGNEEMLKAMEVVIQAMTITRPDTVMPAIKVANRFSKILSREKIPVVVAELALFFLLHRCFETMLENENFPVTPHNFSERVQ